MNLGILLASRGLVHSRTIESIQESIDDFEVNKLNVKWFFTHDLPIPSAQNDLIKRALASECDYLWMVEEDMLIPQTALFAMYSQIAGGEYGVAALDYPLGKDTGESGILIKNGEVWWCAFGCMLVADWVFNKLEYPWIRNDKTWRIINHQTYELEEQDIPNKYGGQDIQFGMTLKKLGIKIGIVPNLTAGHIKIIEKGKTGVNSGCHQVKIYDTIKHKRIYGS